MEHLTDTVAAILPDHRVIVGFGVLLNDMTQVAQCGPGFDQRQRLIQAFLGDADQAISMGCDVADTDHDAGIAMPAIFDHRDVDVDDVAIA